MNDFRRLSSSSSSMRGIKSRFTHGFLRALKRINTQRKPSSSARSTTTTCTREIFKRYLRVKVAADASLASAVGSGRAWSRAMLSGIRRRSCREIRRTSTKKEKNMIKNVISGRNDREKEVEEVNGIRKAKELRELVPGGEAMEICKLLDETAHYIKCLSTQVKVMTAIAESYSAA